MADDVNMECRCAERLASGSVQERYGYSAYGFPAYLSATFGTRASSDYGWERLYCGYVWNAPSASYHVRNRNLWSHLGRWDGRDPIEFEAGDANMYRYVHNGPTQFIDPLGLIECQLKVYAGHDVEARQWIHDTLPVSNGTEIGVVCCHQRDVNSAIRQHRIPRFVNNTSRTIPWDESRAALQRGIDNAKSRAQSLCDQHKKRKGPGCDCDSVTITVSCSAAARQKIGDLCDYKETIDCDK